MASQGNADTPAPFCNAMMHQILTVIQEPKRPLPFDDHPAPASSTPTGTTGRRRDRSGIDRTITLLDGAAASRIFLLWYLTPREIFREREASDRVMA
ncbi:hypothetical protein I6F35_18880 [Bradyrhizobium sp. BRP22]|uniref:hypothetical protein n=1 Tax=Bradyrhizobium sp. BRP22 TaxID=2793821 RepID=UPI001CD5FF60|nr:hypothetical protein [Bradyrhizobium sp. BRP22]MCA1455255.1 hypothetical protein [Bradyrhizobium sp. BRP22]